MRPTRTPEQFEEIAGEVAYEINRMREAADILMKQKSWQQSLTSCAERQFFVNYFLEGFLLHLRNVLDFFYPKSPKGDDVLAAHFFSSNRDWPRYRPRLGPAIMGNRKRLDKALAHITYARLKYKGKLKQWPVDEMLTEMESALDSFLGRLPGDRADWFKGKDDSQGAGDRLAALLASRR